MNALDHGLHTHDCTKPDSSVPSILPSIVREPIVVPHQERGESRDQRKQLYKTGKNPTAVSESSRSSRRPGRERGAPPGRYRCNICGLNYAQQQGVTRHHRDTHEVSLCTHCRDFEWHRPHQLKRHIEEQHPDVDLPASLAEATRSRRKATRIKNNLRGQRVSPTIEHDLWGCVEPPPRLSMPLPAVAKIPPVSLPENTDMSVVDYDMQFESAEPAIRENFKYAFTAFPTIKAYAPREVGLIMPARSEEIWLVSALSTPYPYFLIYQLSQE